MAENAASRPDPAQPGREILPAGRAARRAAWLKTLHQWHWVSSALCLLGMLLFAFTGITLNHGSEIEARPTVVKRQASLPEALQLELRRLAAGQDGAKAPLPAAARQWAQDSWRLQVGDQPAEWTPEEIYLPLPRPGGDAWLRLDLEAGEAEYEITARGWIAYFNDLHKGRHTGPAWNWFIDLFAAACLVFSLTGLFILKMHAASRPSTWPVLGLGVVIPALLALLFIH